MNVSRPKLRPQPRRQPAISLAQKAYFIIQEKILRGDIPLGAPLSRRKLAAELGMSILPVAEALQSLESDGLVESRARAGTRVCLPTISDIRDRYEVREALESHAARLFVTRATDRDRLHLETMAARLDVMFASCSPKNEITRDYMYSVQSFHREFHAGIALATGCHALHHALEHNHVLIFNWLFDVAANRPLLPPRFHTSLIEALNEGDVSKADQAMREHVRYGLDTVLRELGPRSKTAAVSFERAK